MVQLLIFAGAGIALLVSLLSPLQAGVLGLGVAAVGAGVLALALRR